MHALRLAPLAPLALLVACAAGAPVSPPDAAPSPDSARCADDPGCVARTCAYEHYACGTFADVGGDTFDCGACAGASACVDHACAIVADAREDNNELAHATWLGALDDVEDAYLRLAALTIDSRSDQDWFQFHVADTFDGGNPRIAIAVDAASQHELAAWFRCDALDEATIAYCGESQNADHDPALGTGCTANAASPRADIVPYCAGIADGGTVTVRVRKHEPPRGDPYELRVMVR